MPNYFLDDQLGKISPASFSVLAYICRRTLGFNRLDATIPLNQFLRGLEGPYGVKLDNGCGVSNKNTLVACLKELKEKGLIEYQSVRGKDTVYTVILPSTDSILADDEASIKSDTKQVPKVILAPSANSYSRKPKSLPRKKELEKKKKERSITAPIDFSKFEPGGKYHSMVESK